MVISKVPSLLIAPDWRPRLCRPVSRSPPGFWPRDAPPGPSLRSGPARARKKAAGTGSQCPRHPSRPHPRGQPTCAALAGSMGPTTAPKGHTRRQAGDSRRMSRARGPVPQSPGLAQDVEVRPARRYHKAALRAAVLQQNPSGDAPCRDTAEPEFQIGDFLSRADRDPLGQIRLQCVRVEHGRKEGFLRILCVRAGGGTREGTQPIAPRGRDLPRENGHGRRFARPQPPIRSGCLRPNR